MCDFVGTSMLAPGCSADLSLEANSIALKYLSDVQLSHLALKRETKQISSASQPTMDFLSRTTVSERTATGLSILSPTNMSLATQKYMKRYGLIEECDSEEEEEEHHSDTQHDSALGCSAQIESPEKVEGIQRVTKVPSSSPQQGGSPHLEHQGPSVGGGCPTVRLLLPSHRHPGPSGPRGKSSPRPPPAPENHSALGTMETQGSLGNFLDLSRLRQLPKLF